MVQEVQNIIYRTSDGKAFRTREAAEAHENEQRFSHLIDGFINSRQWKRGRDTLARNILVQFLLHREATAQNAAPAV